ncbi:MAG: hypothetical protein NUW21_10580 [Elusimicrobia bacterium]|nr:hypothetical protein [Elusimicrobiota bacterium]
MAIKSWAGTAALACVLAGPAGAAVRPIERMHTPWLQDLYMKSLDAKARSQPFGICEGAQGAFAFDAAAALSAPTAKDGFAPAADGMIPSNGEEGVYLAVLDAVKAAMAGFLSRRQDTQTRLGMIVAGKHDVAKPGEVEKFVMRAVPDSALPRIILEHAGEFPSARRLYHVDAAYARRAPARQSIISVFSIVDLKTRELFFVGGGDCEF